MGESDERRNVADAEELVKKQFGAHARAYVSSPVHARGESLTRLVDLTKPQRAWLVLDVSTGAGHTALAFAPRVARVIATDLTPEMLEAARALAAQRAATNLEFRPADAQALPFDDGMFDLVTNRIALHHYPDARKAVAEMARVCRRGGLVALVDNVVPFEETTGRYINQFEKLRDASHQCAHPVKALERYFATARLKVEHLECLKKDMTFEPWADRMGADERTKAELRRMLSEAPAAVRGFLNPRMDGGELCFTLTEAVLIGRKE